MVNIAYLLTLRTGGMENACEQWEDMQVGLKTWQDFKDNFSQAYIRYHIRKRATAAPHTHGPLLLLSCRYGSACRLVRNGL